MREPIEVTVCAKKRYRRRADAVCELRRTRRKKEELGLGRRNECRAYRCPLCFAWHLTSSERSR